MVNTRRAKQDVVRCTAPSVFDAVNGVGAAQAVFGLVDGQVGTCNAVRFVVQVDLDRVGGGAVVEHVDAAHHSTVVVARIAVHGNASVVTTVNGVVAQTTHKGVAAMFMQCATQHIVAIAAVEQVVAQTTEDGVSTIATQQGVVARFVEISVVGVIVDVIRGDVGTHAIVASSTNDQVVAIVAIQGVVTRTAVDGVCA